MSNHIMRLPIRRRRLGEPEVLFAHDITVEVDTAGIAEKLGLRAALNRSGKSSYLGGLVKVIARRRLTP